MAFEEKQLKSKYIYRGHILNLRLDTVQAVSGEAQREIVEHLPAVGMAALKRDGSFLMEHQFRYAIGEVNFEIPAGLMEKGEEPKTSCVRELREEIGYTPEKVRFLTKCYSSAGFTDETCYIFLCTGLSKGERDLDDDESIDVLEISIDEMEEKVLKGEVPDVKTQSAVLFTAALIRKGELDDQLDPEVLKKFGRA
jgi:ADP-ribose pyrophosphatase